MNTAVNMAQFIAPKSDQINADDLIAGPRTIRITRVTGNEGNAEQPVNVFFDDDSGKPFRPCKSMRRVMVQAWGPDASKYAGRSMTLYRDPKVQFGGMAVGGIRISHMSHIDGELMMSLTASKAKRAPYKVLPLSTDAAPDPATKWAAQYCAKVAQAPDAEALSAFANERAVKLSELEAKRPELHAQCIAALDAKRASFSETTTDAWDAGANADAWDDENAES